MIKECIYKNAYLKYENKIRNNVTSIEPYLGRGLYILLRTEGCYLCSSLSSILIIYFSVLHWLTAGRHVHICFQQDMCCPVVSNLCFCGSVLSKNRLCGPGKEALWCQAELNWFACLPAWLILEIQNNKHAKKLSSLEI